MLGRHGAGLLDDRDWTCEEAAAAGAEITMDARDELVVVFGGSSGIGEAVARTMAARGSRVVIVGRDPGRLAAAASRAGGDVGTAAVNAGDRDAVDAFFGALAVNVDHLVLSFSTGRAGGPFRDLSMADLAAAIRGKLIAYLSVLQAALPGLRADGSVTLIGAGSAESSRYVTGAVIPCDGGLRLR